MNSGSIVGCVPGETHIPLSMSLLRLEKLGTLMVNIIVEMGAAVMVRFGRNRTEARDDVAVS